MAKFLELCEEFDPRNSGDPKWALYDFLKSKGISVSMVRDTNLLYIDTGEQNIAVEISANEEDEQINAGVGTYEVDKEVENLGNKAASGLKGAAGRLVGNSAQRAKSAVKKRQNLAKKAVDVYDKGTKRLEQGLRNAQNSFRSTPTTY